MPSEPESGEHGAWTIVQMGIVQSTSDLDVFSLVGTQRLATSNVFSNTGHIGALASGYTPQP